MRIFAACFWHSEGWSPRNEVIVEAVLRRVSATKHPWLVACADFEKSLWFRKDRMHLIAPEGVSMSRPKSAKGKWVGKVHDHVIACNSLKRNISPKVVEDFESRQLQAVSFVVDRGKEIQDWNEQRLPKTLPGDSGGRLPGGVRKSKCVSQGTGVKGIKEKRKVPRKK